MELPPPPAVDPRAAARWVAEHLGDLRGDGPPAPSPAFRGGQAAADAALRDWDVTGYAARRNEVWPDGRRGASRLSPYVRHGLIGLPALWARVAGGPARDVRRFRDELLWQEYARHMYARLGSRMGAPLRAAPPPPRRGAGEAWPRGMACIALAAGELERDGWVPNQARMWLASHWAVRTGADWRAGERAMFRWLLDGSAAANLLGWQWVGGMATGRAYGFSRRQVERRAPGLCRTCPLEARCPIAGWPEPWPRRPVERPGLLRVDPDPSATAGPARPEVTGAPEAVWLTAESLGDADPALAAHPELPAVFVFDAPMLRRLRLAGHRLVFLAETLGDLARRRPVRVMRGDPVRELDGVALAVTHAPVPGFARRAGRLRVVARHPWPWLCPPHGGTVASWSSWVRRARPREG